MRHYELMVVLSPTLSVDEADGSRERIRQLIDQQGGEITQENQWGMRRLAYPIRKAGQTYLEGNYVLTRFQTERAISRDLEGQLRIAEDVLRYLVVKSEPPRPTPVPVAGPVGAEVAGTATEPVSEGTVVEDTTAAIISEDVVEPVTSPAEVQEAADGTEAVTTDMEADEVIGAGVEAVEVETEDTDEAAEVSEEEPVEDADVVEQPVAEAAPAEEDQGPEQPAPEAELEDEAETEAVGESEGEERAGR